MVFSKIGFLGAGQMAKALAKGVVASGLVAPTALVFCDPVDAQLAAARAQFPGCITLQNAHDLFTQCELIILSVKPQVLPIVASKFAKSVSSNHLLISIAAGISLGSLQEWFATKNVVRVMPNTPAQVAAGVSALASDLAADSESMQIASQIFATVGKVVVVDDAQMDAVTGLSGSGPAYVLMMIEALSDAGVASGLARPVALTLAVQTVLGSAKMVQDTQLHPAVLKDQVTSPAGTTIAGIRVLEANKFRSTLIEAVSAAVNRSRELRG